MQWHIGCSGFYYPEWREVFYPKDVPASKWFEFYCSHFNTLELNGTFYRTPTVSQLRKWYDKSPEHFRFSVKAPRLITHYKRFSNVQQEVLNFYELIADGLAEKEGCILFQLPPTFIYSEKNLYNIINVLDVGRNNVIEFRHASWWVPEVYEALRQSRITFCSISHPSLPDAVVKTNEILYYRFHGVPELYKSSYDVETLNAVVEMILGAHAHENYVYFNNTMYGTAIQNIRVLESLLQHRADFV